MLDIAQRIVEITGSSSAIEFRPLPIDDPWHRQPDIARARQLLAWQPQTSLGDGLAETVRYFSALLQSASASKGAARFAASVPAPVPVQSNV